MGAKAGTMAGEDRPRFAAIPGASFGAAQGALQGILAALLLRASTGRGQKVETSLVQGLTAYELYNWLGPQLPPEHAGKPRTGFTFSPVSGMVAFTRDGRWLQFANFRPHLVDAFLAAVGLTDYYADAMARKESAEAINETVLRRLHEKTLDEWMDIFLRSDDIGVEPFRTPAEALDHPQMLHNGHVLELTDPSLGKTRQVGPLVRMSKTPSSPQEAGAPVLGSVAPGCRLHLGPCAPPSRCRLGQPTGGPAPAVPSAGSPCSSWPGSTRPRSGPPFSPTWAPGSSKWRAPPATPTATRTHCPSSPESRRSAARRASSSTTGRRRDGRSSTSWWPRRTSSCATTASKTAPRSATTTPAWSPPIPTRSTSTPRPTDPTVRTPPGRRSPRRWASPPAIAATSSGGNGPWSIASAITFEEGQEQLAAISLRNGGPTNNADAASALVVGTGHAARPAGPPAHRSGPIPRNDDAVLERLRRFGRVL